MASVELKALNCPKCSAKLSLRTSQRYCRCDFCGTNYAVQPSSRGTSLVAFETLLKDVSDRTKYIEASMRLPRVAADVAEAQAKVEDLQRKLTDTNAAQLELVNSHVTEVHNSSVLRWICGFLAGFMWLLVIFRLEGICWYLALGAAVFLTIGAVHSAERYYRGQWNFEIRQSANCTLLEQTGLDLESAQSHLQDLELEQELCGRRVRQHRYTEETSGARPDGLP